MVAVRSLRLMMVCTFIWGMFSGSANATPITTLWTEQFQPIKTSDVEAAKSATAEDWFILGNVLDIAQVTRIVLAMAANGIILGNETAWLFRSPTQLAKLALGFNNQI